MTSRDKILSAVRQNQPAAKPIANGWESQIAKGSLDEFAKVLHSIGGSLYVVNSADEINDILSRSIPKLQRVFSTDPQIFNGASPQAGSGHAYSDLDLCVLRSALAVAENGAVWINESELPHRALPFIAQHLAVVIKAESIVKTMHDAYAVIGDQRYGYGVFIAGPSKTADIEQSLVMGAHGAMTMTVFVLPK